MKQRNLFSLRPFLNEIDISAAGSTKNAPTFANASKIENIFGYVALIGQGNSGLGCRSHPHNYRNRQNICRTFQYFFLLFP